MPLPGGGQTCLSARPGSLKRRIIPKLPVPLGQCEIRFNLRHRRSMGRSFRDGKTVPESHLFRGGRGQLLLVDCPDADMGFSFLYSWGTSYASDRLSSIGGGGHSRNSHPICDMEAWKRRLSSDCSRGIDHDQPSLPGNRKDPAGRRRAKASKTELEYNRTEEAMKNGNIVEAVFYLIANIAA